MNEPSVCMYMHCSFLSTIPARQCERCAFSEVIQQLFCWLTSLSSGNDPSLCHFTARAAVLAQYYLS